MGARACALPLLLLACLALVGCHAATGTPASTATDTPTRGPLMTRSLPAVTPTRAPSVPASSASRTAATVTPSVTAARGTIFTLLADNRLVALDAADGQVLAALAFAPPPVVRLGAGQYLALSGDRRTLYALIPGSPGSLAVLDTANATVRATHPLPSDGTLFRAILVGPGTDRVYLFGNRTNGVVILVLDPTTGAASARWEMALGEHDWAVLGAAITPDERRVYLSYHGSDTTGIDELTITETGLRRCTGQPRGNVGCVPAHGPFALHGDTLLLQPGDAPDIVAIDGAGRELRRYDTGLVGNHMFAFTVDAAAGRLYAVGSCGYAPGFAALDLATGSSPAPAEPPPPLGALGPPPCGERIAPGGPWAAVARVALAVPDARRAGAILLVDTRLGETFRSIPTPAEPLDVAVVLDPG